MCYLLLCSPLSISCGLSVGISIRENYCSVWRGAVVFINWLRIDERSRFVQHPCWIWTPHLVRFATSFIYSSCMSSLFVCRTALGPSLYMCKCVYRHIWVQKRGRLCAGCRHGPAIEENVTIASEIQFPFQPASLLGWLCAPDSGAQLGWRTTCRVGRRSPLISRIPSQRQPNGRLLIAPTFSAIFFYPEKEFKYNHFQKYNPHKKLSLKRCPFWIILGKWSTGAHCRRVKARVRYRHAN